MFSDSVYAEMLELYGNNTFPWLGLVFISAWFMLMAAGWTRFAVFKRVFLFFVALNWILLGVLFFQGPFSDIAWYGMAMMLVCLAQGSIIAILTTESYRPWRLGLLWPGLLTPLFVVPLESVLLNGVNPSDWVLASPEALNLSLISLSLPLVLQLSAARAVIVTIAPLLMLSHFFMFLFY